MTLFVLLVGAFLIPIATGPACERWREDHQARRAARRARRDAPLARVVYLPTETCRHPARPRLDDSEACIVAEHLHRQSSCAMHTHYDVHDEPRAATSLVAGTTTTYLPGGGTLTTIHLTDAAKRGLSVGVADDTDER